MTQIKLLFSIFGDLFNPETLSDILKISPIAFWSKGDLVPNRNIELVRKETCWEYSTGFIQTLNFEDVSVQFIKLINPNIHLLEKYIGENKLQTKIDIVVEIVNDEKPSLYIGKDFIELLVRINGEIDIDLYYLKE
jgi:hypothetical protein